MNRAGSDDTDKVINLHNEEKFHLSVFDQLNNTIGDFQVITKDEIDQCKEWYTHISSGMEKKVFKVVVKIDLIHYIILLKSIKWTY